MDWNRAIEKNREALKRIVTMLVALAGLGALPFSPCGRRWPSRSVAQARSDEGCWTERGAPDWNTPHPPSPGTSPGSGTFSHKGRREEGATAVTLPRRLHRVILRLLRPAESAVRRLIIVMARGIAVAPPPVRLRKPKPRPASSFIRDGVGTGIVMPPGMVPPPLTPPHLLRPWGEGGANVSESPSPLWGGVRGGGRSARPLGFPLLDPLRTPFRPRRPVRTSVPRISWPGFSQPFPIAPRRAPAPDDALDATRLVLRLQALAAALDDLPGQAKRFARWKSRRDAARNNRARAAQNRKPRRVWPLRPGRPPGSCQRSGHEVHELLTELHGLAFEVLEKRDTS